jgi:hypothetical protein
MNKETRIVVIVLLALMFIVSLATLILTLVKG